MNDHLITNLEQVTIEWLTAVLHHSGALTQGHVTSFDVADGRGNWSTNGSLRLQYSPDAQGERPLYLIDRQPFDWGLTTWLGVYDLAYAIVFHGDMDTRQWERPILQQYHQTLINRGVQGYTWEQLWDDYRLCVAMGVYIAVEYCRGQYNEDMQWVWLPMLQKALTACDDLNCTELWR